jgi:hypothetical protein
VTRLTWVLDRRYIDDLLLPRYERFIAGDAGIGKMKSAAFPQTIVSADVESSGEIIDWVSFTKSSRIRSQSKLMALAEYSS